MAHSTQPIMMVEDSPDDIYTAKWAFSKSRLKNEVIFCTTAEEALEQLQETANSQGASHLPGIILLDLNLPGMNGAELLAELKSDPKLRRIPVVMLTSSSDERDITRCYDLGANSYLIKPVNLESFMAAINRLTDYWLELSILPPERTAD